MKIKNLRRQGYHCTHDRCCYQRCVFLKALTRCRRSILSFEVGSSVCTLPVCPVFNIAYPRVYSCTGFKIKVCSRLRSTCISFWLSIRRGTAICDTSTPVLFLNIMFLRLMLDYDRYLWTKIRVHTSTLTTVMRLLPATAVVI